MNSHRSPSGLILLVALAAGTALGIWLAIWLVRGTGATPGRGRPSSEWREPADGERVAAYARLRLVRVWAASPPPTLAGPSTGAETPSVLLVGLPNAGPLHRAFLFIRPADAALCRTLHGTEIDTFWQGSQPVGVCSVADPARAELAALPVESRARRSS